MTDRPPTDAAIVKGFEKFEQGFNVAIHHYRTQSVDDAGPHISALSSLWAAHSAYRELAVAAQARIDAKKGGAK